MEKLIELLNEYEKEVKKSEKVWSIDNDWDICRQTYEWVDYNEYTEYMNTNNLISKSFWFIKWLVENDKIDLWEKLFNLTKNDNRKSIICDLDNNDFSWEDTFLMLLAISNSPVEDLLLYLK